MTPDLLLPIALLFMAIAVVTGLAAATVLGRTSPEQRRLRQMAYAAPDGQTVGLDRPALVERPDPRLERVARSLPKSPKEMGRLRRRLATAGIVSFRAAVIYSVAEVTLPLTLAASVLLYMDGFLAWLGAAVAAVFGYVLPGLILERMIFLRKRSIEEGLPDALDLMIVCVEAGSALDQAIMKAAEELMISHPALAGELQTINTEIRAGKPRVEAFKNFAARTKVDDVRALVAMLVQTDRFGTSVSQALRTHAVTSRTKRRQRAEEKAAKIGVKLVFPLVLFLFPAFYVVALGPAMIQFIRIFFAIEF